jgi:hypothetical protein
MGLLHRLIALTLIVAIASPVSLLAQGQTQRAERVAGQPNLNGVWMALNSANWNVEAHPATALDEFWRLGALAAIPAGQSVIDGSSIPYLPAALEKRSENQAGWPAADPETLCYLPGIPRANYMPFPFQIVQGGGDILFVYSYHSANRLVAMENHIEPPVDSWMGQSNGRWEGDTLVIDSYGFNGKAWLDRSGNHHSPALVVEERFTLMTPDHIDYRATLSDARTYSEPWTIQMPLYRMLEPNAQLLEHKCVPFVEELLYKDLELEESN